MASGRFNLHLLLATSALAAQLVRPRSGSEPNKFLELQPHVGQNKRLEQSCFAGAGFEDVLDKLSYALLESYDHREGGVIDAVSLAGSVLPKQQITSAHAKAGTARLQDWLDAVARTQRRLRHTLHLNEQADGSAHKAGHVQALRPNATRVLPPGCPSFVPSDDAYWSKEDSYWVADYDGVQRPYSVCMYSKNCTQKFTNGDRLSSLRATIHATHELLKQWGVTYMLYGGTIIGAHRCNDILPWDYDTDITVHQDSIGPLVKLLASANTPKQDYQGHNGRWIDLGQHGLPGFTLMEKFPGCLPLIVVDQSTGFFTDMFPMKPHGATIYSPWTVGRVSCDSQVSFDGCNWNLCDTWSTSSTLPTSDCLINNNHQSCAHDTTEFLHEYYGPGIEKPDREVRTSPALAQTSPGKTEEPSSSIYFVIITIAFAIPIVMGVIGVPLAAVVFTFYLGLYMTWAMLTYATRGESYNSGILVLNALLFKLLISFGLWRAWEGASFVQLPQVAWQARGPLFQYVVPAGLYALSDIIRVNALQALDASTFAILFNSRMLFLAFVWQWALNRKLLAIHWASLLCVMVGCCLWEYPNVQEGSHESRQWGYVQIAILGVITSFATVWNEMLLQKRSDVGVSLQNLAMYIWGTIFTIIMVIVWSVWDPSRQNNPFDAQAWKAIWGQPLVLASAMVLALYGVATAYFLRYLSNITREVTLGAFAPLLSVVMDLFLFKLMMGPIEYVGLAFVLLGVILFAFKPVLAIDADSQEDNGKNGNPADSTPRSGDGSSTVDTPTKEVS